MVLLSQTFQRICNLYGHVIDPGAEVGDGYSLKVPDQLVDFKGESLHRKTLVLCAVFSTSDMRSPIVGLEGLWLSVGIVRLAPPRRPERVSVVKYSPLIACGPIARKSATSSSWRMD